MIGVSVQYNGGLLSTRHDTVDPMLLPSENPIECHEEVLVQKVLMRSDFSLKVIPVFYVGCSISTKYTTRALSLRNLVSGYVVVFVVAVSHIQRIGCQPEKTTLHDGHSRSWSAEQGKENKRESLAAYPPPPTLLVRRKIKNKNNATRLQALRKSWSVSRPYKDIFCSSTGH